MATTNIATILDLLEDHSIRSDGRRPYELRRIEHRFGEIQTATGSVWLRQGGTTIVCGVFGPHEITPLDTRHQKQHRHANQGQLTVNCQVNGDREALRGLSIEASTIASLVKQALEAVIIWDQTSRSVINVFLTVETADGSVLSTAMNAASLATTSTAIPMKDIVTCCSSSLIRGNFLVDVWNDFFWPGEAIDKNRLLDSQEESIHGPSLTLCKCPKLGHVLWIEVGSKYGRAVHSADFRKLLNAAGEGCRAVLFVAEGIIEREWKERIAKHVRVCDD